MDEADAIKELQQKMFALTRVLESNLLTPAAWYDQMSRLLARYSTSTFYLGLGQVVMPPGGLGILKQYLDTQLKYLRRFRNEIEKSPEFQNRWYARANLYANSIKIPFSEAEIYQQFGRFLPLPAMPAQGTQCLSNCWCRWRVEQVGKNDYDAYWILDPKIKDHCQTCKQRDLEWNPVRIRGGRLVI